jgi:hypothetical protein
MFLIVRSHHTGVAHGVERPSRESRRDAAGAADGERVHEHEDLRSSVDGGTEQVVVVPEEFGVIATEVEMRCEADDHDRVDVPVSAAGKVAEVVRKHGGVHLLEPCPLEAAVEQPLRRVSVSSFAAVIG